MKTEHFVPLKRVNSVSKTKAGLLASVDGEQLRIDVINAEVVRIKVSVDGIFDEKPTYAVAEEPKLSSRFKLKTNNGVTTLVTAALVVRVQHEPFSLDTYRTDGSVVFESVRDEAGSWGYARSGNEFVIRRKVGVDDPIYGLGEKTGGFNRRGRDFTMWNTDVLNPTASGEFTGQYEKTDPRSDNTSTEFDPYYVSIPFYYHQDAQTAWMS